MKTPIRFLSLIAACGALATIVAVPSFTGTARADAPKATLPLFVYDKNGGKMNFIPSGYMGNTGAIKMAFDSTDNPHSGTTCVKVDYTAGDQWGGVYWQSPANDWEDAKPGGWDLTGATKLDFWARGATGGEVVTFGFGGDKKDQAYPNTAKGALDKVALTKDWKEYSIDLKDLDLSRIKEGFMWVVGGSGAPITFYLDDIKYE